MAFRIRTAHPSDEQQLLSLAPRLTEGVAPWRDPGDVRSAVIGWVRSSLQAFTAGDGVLLVAEQEPADGVAGFVSVSVRRHFSGAVDAYVGELVVHPSHEGAGLGRQLVEHAAAWSRERGHRVLTLETGAANTRARGFYERLGFREEDVRLTLLLDERQAADV